VMVVVDEAYYEYVREPDYPDTSRWLGDFPNLIVTRTFSKAYGLAGLRIGYGLSDPRVAELLNRVRQPFNANSLALAAAEAALGDREHLDLSVALNREGLAQLANGFEALGLGYIPSVGNFLTVDLGRPAAPVDQALLREGCITRPVANYGLPNHLRVSVGLPAENERLLGALARVLG
jgi:histidinol-phosphate aminotransferase